MFTIKAATGMTLCRIVGNEDNCAAMAKIGVISDTHGLLREQALSRLQGCDAIIHAGDVGDPSVLEELREVAEVVAVRGNTDTGPWAADLPRADYLDVEGRRIGIVHDIGTLDLNPATAGVQVVVYGHSHRPAANWREGILYLNPGSAGPRRFHLPVSMAVLHIQPGEIVPEIIEL